MKLFKYQIPFKHLIFNNFWLKVIALIMAIITWLWASGEFTTSGIKI